MRFEQNVWPRAKQVLIRFGENAIVRTRVSQHSFFIVVGAATPNSHSHNSGWPNELVKIESDGEREGDESAFFVSH